MKPKDIKSIREWADLSGHSWSKLYNRVVAGYCGPEIIADVPIRRVSA